MPASLEKDLKSARKSLKFSRDSYDIVWYVDDGVRWNSRLCGMTNTGGSRLPHALWEEAIVALRIILIVGFIVILAFVILARM